jgi:hypothetical protein
MCRGVAARRQRSQRPDGRLFYATVNATGHPHGLGDAVLGLPFADVQFVLDAVVIIIGIPVVVASPWPTGTGRRSG